MYGVTYVITNAINGKQYVGQARRIKVRWNWHKGAARRGVKYYLYNAMRKYGIEKFSILQIDVADSLDELNEQETFHTHRLNTLYPNGYNLVAPGGRKEWSDEAYRRHRESHAHVSLETRKKQSIANTRTECRRGHPFTLDNIYLSRGKRTCLKCARETSGLPLTGVANGKKDHCVHGHPFDEVNTYIRPNGSGRQCLLCTYINCGAKKIPERLQKYLTEEDLQKLSKNL
jgi:hypothetical protein